MLQVLIRTMNKYILFLTGICLFACNKQDSVKPSAGYDYYPLQVSSYNVYKVSGRIKNALQDSLFSYEMLELTSKSYTEGEQQIYVLEKFIRASSGDAWPDTPDTVQSVRLANNQLIHTVNNKPVVKLVFPPKEGKRWNSNSFNTDPDVFYTMKNVNKGYTLNNQSYPSAIVVEQAMDTTNRIQRNKQFEVYARNTGLIYAYSEILSLDFSSGDTTSVNFYTREYLYSSR